MKTSARVVLPASAPANVARAIADAVSSMTAARVRYRPCCEAKPTLMAPIAPGTPSDGEPAASATMSGIATPTLQRTAKPKSARERSRTNALRSARRSVPPCSDAIVRLMVSPHKSKADPSLSCTEAVEDKRGGHLTLSRSLPDIVDERLGFCRVKGRPSESRRHSLA